MPTDCAQSSAATPRPEAPFRRGSDLSLLAEARRREVHVVHVARLLPEPLRAYARRVAAGVTGEVRVVLDSARPSVSALVEGLPDELEQAALHADLATLVGRFFGVTGASSLHAELAVVAHDKCRKYHADYVGMRLLCTYAGPGTDWVEETAVDRAALDHVEACADTCNARVLRGPEVHRCEAGDVLVLKGHSWPGNAGFGAVHRSPPVEARGERRLVFTLTTT